MIAKQVLILLGSPRKTGNTAILAQHLAEGAEGSGADVRTLYLHGMNISPCTGCNHCQEADANGCIIVDDMQDIYGHLREADSIVFASPVYWFSVTAQIKMVIDRIYAVNALRMFQDISAYLGVRIAGAVYGSAYEAGEIRDSTEVLKAARELGMKLGG